MCGRFSSVEGTLTCGRCSHVVGIFMCGEGDGTHVWRYY